MGANSKIQWTDHTFNPWTGCAKISPGCANCYAETWAKRSGLVVWGQDGTRRVTSDANWREPLKWNRDAEIAGVRARVFCASLADVMEDREELDAPRARLYDLIRKTPWLDWLLLSKRPENFAGLLPEDWIFELRPQPNVWLMTTVESQEYAWRMDELLAVPAVVHGISYEPALGPLDLEPWLDRLSWVIAGGESGPKARPANPEWFRDVRFQCQRAGVPFFFKQWGEYGPTSEYRDGQIFMSRFGKERAGRLLDGVEHNEFPVVRP